MAFQQFEKLITSSVLANTSSPVDTRHVAHLGIDTTWAWAASPAPVTAVTGTLGKNVVTFPAVAGATEGDFLYFIGPTGTAWIVALDVDGGGITNAGTVFTSVPVANVAVVDISALVGAADVAAACVAALNLLVGFTNDFTLTDNLDGTVDFEGVTRAPLGAFTPYIADETAPGSVTSAVSVVGVASKFQVTSDNIQATGHGLVTGQAVQLTIGAGALPAPFVVLTDYFVIRIDADTFQLADTYAHALAGTPLDITDEGEEAETVTFTVQANVGSIKYQYTTDIAPKSSSVWVDFKSIDLVAASSPQQERVSPNYYGWIRAVIAVTKGNLTSMKSVAFGKEQG